MADREADLALHDWAKLGVDRFIRRVCIAGGILQLELVDQPIQTSASHSQHPGGPGFVALRSLEHAHDMGTLNGRQSIFAIGRNGG